MTNTETELLKRITSDPKIFGGKPIIRGMRISVETVVSLLAQGESVEAILGDYPALTRETSRRAWPTPMPSSPMTPSTRCALKDEIPR